MLIIVCFVDLWVNKVSISYLDYNNWTFKLKVKHRYKFGINGLIRGYLFESLYTVRVLLHSSLKKQIRAIAPSFFPPEGIRHIARTVCRPCGIPCKVCEAR